MRLYSYALLNEKEDSHYKEIFSELLKKFNVSSINDLSVSIRDEFFKELINKMRNENNG